MARCQRMLAAGSAAALVVGLLAGPFAAPAPVAAITPARIYASLGWNCVSITGSPSTAHTVTLLEGSIVLDAVTRTTDGSGSAVACLDTEVAAGLKLRIQKAGYSRTITVPNLGVKAERGSDVISGSAPAGQTVTIAVERLQTGLFAPLPSVNKEVTATASGTYSWDWTANGGLRGGDFIRVVYGTSAGDYIAVRWVTEYMRIVRGSPRVTAAVNPGGAEIELQNASGGVRARARLALGPTDGGAIAAFMTATGVLRSPRAGDKVVGDFAADATITMPAIVASGVAWSDVVTITCPGMAGQGAQVLARKDDYSDQASRVGVTNASGIVSWDLTADIDLAAGDVLWATCRYDSGDEVGVHGRVGS